ncbi:uncharacterized protein MONBRDRAFT_33902 [Monosiga brevicollis MX1]|uniref:CAP-Gly domain-containing protein n=1 Tax=Monosiga brevicollis TaxID=81824 RepID=A9V8B5_MONBE|nr:uncharacterized protein MONBRDRAFT_33902 [Monosiga brevicollis MX1]EDQ86242.1 predicted protein [Monosiga brevicollis MX1]|eukprot:XP_001748912.1 hypothetical protein [Monosiga brevicollis MX1]
MCVGPARHSRPFPWSLSSLFSHPDPPCLSASMQEAEQRAPTPLRAYVDGQPALIEEGEAFEDNPFAVVILDEQSDAQSDSVSVSVSASTPVTATASVAPRPAARQSTPGAKSKHLSWFSWKRHANGAASHGPQHQRSLSTATTDTEEAASDDEATVPPQPVRREPLPPTTKPTRGILKQGTRIRRQSSLTRLQQYRAEVARERRDAAQTDRTTAPRNSTINQRHVSFRDKKGQRKVRLEAYVADAGQEDLKSQLERRLSQRSSITELAKRRILTQFDLEHIQVVEITGISAEDRRSDPTWTQLSPDEKIFIRKELNELKASMEVHEDSRHLTRFHADGPDFPQFEGREGARVTIQGYPCAGTLRFYGPHKTRLGKRCGIELDKPIGKNNGTVDGHCYFTCEPHYGVLCNPVKVSLQDGPPLFKTEVV